MTSWENKKKLAETTLKKRYNGLRLRCLAMDDGTADIVKNPVFKRLNDELIDIAKSIAELNGVEVDLEFKGTKDAESGMSVLLGYFKQGELYKGFEVENAA